MENNEKRQGDNTPREQNQGGKKPYYKHNRRRGRGHSPRPQSTAETQPREDAVQTEAAEAQADNPKKDRSFNSSRPRRPWNRGHDNNRGENTADMQKSDSVNTVQAEQKADSRQGDGFRRRQKNGKLRSDTKAQNDMFSAALESVLSDKEPATIPEAKYSEYTTTAGSLDAEIIDELNSVSAAEAERMAEETVDEAPEVVASEPEAELARYTVVGVRFKVGGKVYYFDPGEFKFTRGDALIVETSRGLEFGMCELGNRTVTEREVVLPLRTVVRRATDEDIARHDECVKYEKEAYTICAEKILDHKLGMKLIDVEYAFDGSKLLFYFTADGRVDFRELVKDLASVFRTRIELRQIGIRDETKLLGGIGICGRPFCCKTFLSDFVQVSIKMAKEQNLSLNSAKISGACGRLMCCLRYEYDTYQEEIKKTPKVDQIVSTPDGDGTVIEVQPLAGLVRVRFGTKAEMLTPKVYHRDEVTVIGGKGVKPKDEGNEA